MRKAKKERHPRPVPEGYDPLSPGSIPGAAFEHLVAARGMIREYVDRGGNENSAPMTDAGDDDEMFRELLQAHLTGYEETVEETGLPHPDAVELYRLLEGELLDDAIFVQIGPDEPLRVRTPAGIVMDAPTDVSRLLAISRTTGEQELEQPERQRLMDWPSQKRDPSAFQETMHFREPRLAAQAYSELCERIAEDLAPHSVWAEEFFAARDRRDAGIRQQEEEEAAGIHRYGPAADDLVFFDDGGGGDDGGSSSDT